MNEKETMRILRLPVQIFVKNSCEMDVRFETNSENGYFVPGNDWRNFYLRGLLIKISLFELIRDGWERKIQ